MKNNRNKVLKAIGKFGGKVLSAPERAYRESKTRGYDKQYRTYKMVNDADKSGVRDKGEASDPLFRGRAAMKEAQRQALKRSI